MTETTSDADFTIHKEDQVVTIQLRGDWLKQAVLPAVDRFIAALGPTGTVERVQFDAEALKRWNGSLVLFVAKCRQLCQEHRVDLRTGALPPGVVKLLELSSAGSETQGSATPIRKSPVLQRIGESVVHAASGAEAMLTFFGESVLSSLRLLRGKAQFRWSDAMLVMQECGPEALGIVALINFLVGMIIAFVGATQLAAFGASIYVADLVAIATVRELGCLMTGIIICGRTGAAFAAQLGTMKVNQELEAFQTFGFSPAEFLVLPRMLALVLMMPLLCVFADLIAMAGGFLVSISMLDVTSSVYVNRTIAAVTLTSFLLGVFKGAFFGFLVALTGCLRGMQCGSNAAAVGRATTSAVVTGITAIIASDGVFAVICNRLKI